MALTPGSSIGAFTVTSLLGTGGMGEVYRARDSRLNREVALKVVSDAFARDTERLARFKREAQVLASLNHPNIGAIYGLEESNGKTALVLELVEGPTLADHIARGPLAISEAIAIAEQIANALEAAHDRGIIHRDLKPANIKVRPDGAVKVLDFGLAKALSGDPASAANTTDLSVSPTISVQGTFAGTILGTAAYMSPEQARGKPVDHRTDIWAFGCVLFEMLTGKQAFPPGDTISDAVASILTREPDFTQLPGTTPASVRRLLKRALAKNPRERLSHIVDARLDLQEIAAPPEVTGQHTSATRGTPSFIVTAATVVLASIITGLVAWTMARRQNESSGTEGATRFVMTLPKDQALTGISLLDLSPDGRRLVYTAEDRLFIRDFAKLEPSAITDANARPDNPVFSPDGQFVAYSTRIGGQNEIHRVSAAGGNPTAICPIPGLVFGLRWVGDRILYTVQNPNGGIYEVPAAGGTPRLLVASSEEEFLANPDLLPDGETLVYVVAARGVGTFVAQNLNGGERRTIVEDVNVARVLPSGHVLFTRGSSLIVQPLSLSTLTLDGTPRVIDTNLMLNISFRTSVVFAVSPSGSLAYATEPDTRRRLVWVDREGHETPIAAEPKSYIYPRISPDGTKIALSVHDREYSIWVWNNATETLNRVTLDKQDVRYSLWMPDSRRLVYSLAIPGKGRQLMSIPPDGSGRAEPLSDEIANLYPSSVSPDAKSLVFRQGPPANFALRLLSFEERLSRPLLERDGRLFAAEISPNGRWLAYQLGEPGASEVYVQPFPNVEDGRWQVSARGGSRPLWSSDSRELFYLSGDGTRLEMAPIGPGPSFTSGRPVEVLDVRRYVSSFPVASGDVGRAYDITPDGKRFLMLSAVSEASHQMVIVERWFQELSAQP